MALLDTYPGAILGLSTRLLRSAYAGAAVRAYKAGPTEADIGFVGGNFDAAALATFMASGDALLTTAYDQSGNARNFTQGTAASMPWLATGGVAHAFGTRQVLLEAKNTNTFVSNGAAGWGSLITTEATMLIVFEDDNDASFSPFNEGIDTHLHGFGGVGYSGWFLSTRFDNIPASATVNAKHVMVVQADESGGLYSIRRNGSSYVSQAMAGRSVIAGATWRAPSFAASTNMDGRVCEIVVWPTRLSLAQAQAIETDATNYWVNGIDPSEPVVSNQLRMTRRGSRAMRIS